LTRGAPCPRLELHFMYRIVISPSADADLFNILEYIAHELENPQAATDFADGVERCYADLEEMPSAHSLCADPLLRIKGYRKYPVGNYLIIYRIVEESKEVRIVHIFHETQNYLEIQKRPPSCS